MRWAITSVSVAEVIVWPLGHQLGAQGGVVLDDPVVDDGQAPGAVEVGVGVLRRRVAVGGPAGVADPGSVAGRRRTRPPCSSARSATDRVPSAARTRQISPSATSATPAES